jgi:hypothetical protein
MVPIIAGRAQTSNSGQLEELVKAKLMMKGQYSTSVEMPQAVRKFRKGNFDISLVGY